jgi:hypothetical protein
MECYKVVAVHASMFKSMAKEGGSRVVSLRHQIVPRVSRGMTSQRVEVTSYAYIVYLHLTLTSYLTRPWQDHSLITFHVENTNRKNPFVDLIVFPDKREVRVHVVGGHMKWEVT